MCVYVYIYIERESFRSIFAPISSVYRVYSRQLFPYNLVSPPSLFAPDSFS